MDNQRVNESGSTPILVLPQFGVMVHLEAREASLSSSRRRCATEEPQVFAHGDLSESVSLWTPHGVVNEGEGYQDDAPSDHEQHQNQVFHT